MTDSGDYAGLGDAVGEFVDLELDAAVKRLESVKPPVLRIRDEPAFVLASSPWSETSVIAELFTRNHGRVVVTVRGAKRPGSKFRGLINPFYPLMVTYSGRAEVKNLTDAKWMGRMAPVGGEALMSAFYMNELVMRLTVREIPEPALFDAYVRALAEVAGGEGVEIQRSLRSFEATLLRLTGWGPAPEDFIEGEYFLRCGELVSCTRDAPEPGDDPVSRDAARAIFSGDFSQNSVLTETRNILRKIIGYYVGDMGLNTRHTISKWQGLSGR